MIFAVVRSIMCRVDALRKCHFRWKGEQLTKSYYCRKESSCMKKDECVPGRDPKTVLEDCIGHSTEP